MRSNLRKYLTLFFALTVTPAHANELLVETEASSWTLMPQTVRLYLNKFREAQFDMQVRFVHREKNVNEVLRYAVTGCKLGKGQLGLVTSEGEFSATVYEWTTLGERAVDELALKLCAKAVEAHNTM